MRFTYIIILTAASLILNSCLDTDFEDPNTDFILSTSLGDDNQDRFEMDGDEIRIFSVRFFMDNIKVIAVDENERFESNPTHVALNAVDITGNTALGAGFILGGAYTGVSFSLTLPPTDADIEDELLIERNSQGDVISRNTLAITGTFNNMGFTILTDITPELEYNFDRVIEMPETNGSLQVNLIAEWETWFLDNSMESILDPTDAANHPEIIENFQQFFTAETLTIGEL